MGVTPGGADRGFDNFAAFFAASPMARFRHARREAGALPVRMLLVDQPAHADDDAATPDLVVGLVLGGRAPARWRWGGTGAPWHSTPARRPGDLGLTPVGAPGTFEVAGPSRMLIVALPFAALRARLAPDAPLPDAFGPLHERYTRSPLERALCERMWAAAAEPSPLADLLVDACAQALVLSFAARAAGRRAAPPPGPPGESLGVPPARGRPLPAAAARRVDEVVRTLPPRALTAAALAEAAGLPERTFRAQFRARHRMSPRAYVVAARVAAARELLAGTDRPIAEVAHALGFAHQAHLTRVFAEHVGTTPARYRQAAGGQAARGQAARGGREARR